MTDLEMDDRLARIRRAQDETDKLVDEVRKLRAEERKFYGEGGKLRAEAGKLQREQISVFLTSGAAPLGAGAVFGGFTVRLLTGD